MRQEDLDAVLEVTNTAFRGLVERTSGRRPEGPLFAAGLGRYRLILDPGGCHVAARGDEVVGANSSVVRGTLGWFGPLAVRPDHQGQGLAQRLVAECLRSAEERGVRLMGLETLANSAQHIHLYQKLGFRSSWTGISYRGDLHDGKMPFGVEVDGPIPNLAYLFPGFDAAEDAHATRSAQVGVTLTCGDGFAVCHLEGTLWAEPGLTYVPLVVAPDRATFDRLMGGIDAVSRDHGNSQVATQVPGSAWTTQEALLDRGYRPAGAALRMKRGDGADYDAGDFYYCDDWH